MQDQLNTHDIIGLIGMALIFLPVFAFWVYAEVTEFNHRREQWRNLKK